VTSNIETILPDSISIYKNLLAFDLAVGEWMEGDRIDKLLIYCIDTVEASALPALAEQFDVLGYKGWALCNTEQDRRNLIKKAIELHRYKGTVWAIRESLKSIGFTDVTVEEGVNGHWARFRVTLNNQNVPITDASFSNVIFMINEYKNTRSVLDAVIMKLFVSDSIQIEDGLADVLEEIKGTDNIIFNGALFHDGTALHDGTWNRTGEADVVTITP
jgi:phage tail P2-like protein